MNAFFHRFSKNIFSAHDIRFMVRMAHTNRLAQEKSPYLLQHKSNPINWYPWGKEAFDVARERNVPIFLSVGYSTCHWCHVMEKESFENEEIAQIMNENFVSIKVDKEERPDVDKLYMAFIQAISGGGGWPMSVFLTPDLAPITGGTYFPPKDSFGRPGFATILNLISEKWTEDPELMVNQGTSLMAAIQKSIVAAPGETPPFEMVKKGAFDYLKRRFDKRNGGFGDAPKFPKPVDLDFLLYFSIWNGESTEGMISSEMLDRTLDAMDRGGIHDHVGKGFHRYSVDSGWHVPHFEKMLYDQSQLLATYAEFHMLTGKYGHNVKDIIDYVDANLKHKDGGFFSAEDADSYPIEGDEHKKEGAFCVWTRSEVEEVLKNWKAGENQLADVVCAYYDVQEEGNVPRSSDPHGELINKNVLIMHKTHDEYANDFGLNEGELKAAIDEAKAFLSSRRALRPKPHLDSKIVTCWQGLMISGLCKAYSALKDETILEKALKNVTFIKEHLMNEDGSLKRAVYTGEDGTLEQDSSPILAFSDDYAFLIEGLISLYQITLDYQYLKLAVDLQKVLDEQYWDTEKEGGYFVSSILSKDGPGVRMMEDQDGAEPCGNSVAVGNLIRFAELMDSQLYRQRADKILRAAAQRLEKYPHILCKMIPAYARLDEGHTKIVIVGSRSDARTRTFLDYIQGVHIWNKTVVLLDNTDKEPSFLEKSCEHYSTMKNVSQPTVFICEGFECGIPITSGEVLREKLEGLKSKITLSTQPLII